MTVIALPAEAVAAPRCTACAGRPARCIASYNAGDPRGLTHADRRAAEAGPGAHVHVVPDADVFAVVIPQQ
ncbi:hypothetical protein GCM10027168_44740 [Streptomyces capparidis]